MQGLRWVLWNNIFYRLPLDEEEDACLSLGRRGFSFNQRHLLTHPDSPGFCSLKERSVLAGLGQQTVCKRSENYSGFRVDDTTPKMSFRWGSI